MDSLSKNNLLKLSFVIDLEQWNIIALDEISRI